ncbi:hypothetical protein L208DRAFT_1035467, partial [Tricholoma matsutake]
SHKCTMPGPIITLEGSTGYFIDKLLDWKQYLVQWLGYGLEHNMWLPRSKL